MGGAIYGDVCAIRLAERLLRQADNFWMLGESAPSLCETPRPERGKCPAEESNRQHTLRNSPGEIAASPSG